MEKELDTIEFNKIKELYIEPILSIIKLIVALSMPIGFIYLFSFTSVNHIPMPLSLTELPALLISIFFLGSWFSLILTGFALFPLISKSWLLEDKSHKNIFGKNDSKNTVKFLCTIGVPIILVILGVIFASTQNFNNYLVYGIAFFLAICFFVYGIFSYYQEDRLRISSILLIFLLISFYWIFLGLAFILALVLEPDYLTGISDFWGYFIFFIFSIFMVFLIFLMVVPFKNKKPFPKLFWITAGTIAIMLPPLVNPAAVKLTEVSLKLMKLGGGYQTQIMLNEPYSKKIPPHLIDPNMPERSVTLSVILDIGKRVYVKLNDSTLIYALPSEVITTQIFGIEKKEKK